jgi:succinate dehydrogenase / fumarate reductase flavoprotein subunit
MEVAPTAHYSMGGIVVDPDTHGTGVGGLFAAGECTGGLHGANRLGGNSLTETVVYGRRAGEAAAATALGSDVAIHPRRVIDEAEAELDELVRPAPELARPLQRQLRDLMWERCGVVRDEAGLGDGLRRLAELRLAAAEVDVRPSAEGWTDLALALDLRAGLTVAEASLLGALERRESRGCHSRSDFAALDAGLLVNFLVQADAGGAGLSLSRQPVPPVPDELGAWVDEEVRLEEARRLQE